MVKHSLVKHANPRFEGTKGGGCHEKLGRVVSAGEGSCDRSCHLVEKNIAIAKLLLIREGCGGVSSLTSSFSHSPSPASANH